MKSFFLIFWLGHLIGDFVFQTNKIAYLKSQSKNGLLIHVGFVWIAQLLVMSSFGYTGLWAATICSFMHYFVDVLKLKLTKRGYKETYLFLFDQSLHATVLLLLTFVFGSAELLIPLNLQYIRVAVAFLSAGYAGSVFMIIALRDFDEERKKGMFFKPKERIVDVSFLVSMLAIHMIEKPLAIRVIIFVVSISLYSISQKKLNNYNYRIIIFKSAIMTMTILYAMMVYKIFA